MVRFVKEHTAFELQFVRENMNWVIINKYYKKITKSFDVISVEI